MRAPGQSCVIYKRISIPCSENGDNGDGDGDGDDIIFIIIIIIIIIICFRWLLVFWIFWNVKHDFLNLGFSRILTSICKIRLFYDVNLVCHGFYFVWNQLLKYVWGQGFTLCSNSLFKKMFYLFFLKCGYWIWHLKFEKGAWPKPTITLFCWMWSKSSIISETTEGITK